jgi:hypothetical protein
MTLTVANFIQHLETFNGHEFRTVVHQKPFTLLFHDSVKLRIRLETHDISVPISILLFGIVQLLVHKKLESGMCRTILGKDWGFGYIARLLLECDDVVLEPSAYRIILNRIKPEKHRLAPIKPPLAETVATNPGNGSTSSP